MTETKLSATRQAIETIGAGPVAALLGPLGFQRRAPHFWRARGEIHQILNFQANPMGSSEAGSFTINIGLTSPFLYKTLTGRAMPTNPGTALWPLSLRIGSLMPGGADHWWPVERAEPAALEQLGEAVVEALELYALPFFAAWPDQETIRQRLDSGGLLPGIVPNQIPLIRAALAMRVDDRDAARAHLDGALRFARGKPFETTIRLIAGRLGLRISKT